MSTLYFVIVSANDNPLYEQEFNPTKNDEQKHLQQFLVHSALDVVSELQFTTQSYNLKVVDKFNDMNVSAYILPSGAKFMLLHEVLNSDGIKHFFAEVHELYIRLLMNPFMCQNDKINSVMFDQNVKTFAKKWL